jgi:uncharacterized protein with von Willebrand factor type A (vWA) domain
MINSTKFKVLKIRSVKKEYYQHLRSFVRYVKNFHPFKKHFKYLSMQKNKFKKGIFDLETFTEDINYYKQLEKFTVLNDLDYWEKQINNSKADIKLLRKSILQKWEETLKKLFLKWKKEKKLIFEQRLIKWLTIKENFYMNTMDLPFQEELFNLLKGDLRENNFEEVLKRLKIIEKTEGLKELFNILGKKMFNEKKSKLKKIPTSINKKQNKLLFDGIKLDNDISTLLPHELMLLNSEYEILFFKKFIEKNLLCFDVMENELKKENSILTIEKTDTTHKKGDIILCIDTSSSMQGDNENIAKAISLYIASKAINEKRKCIIINFSTLIDTFEVNGNIKEMINFLKKSFHGGTDITLALKEVMNLIHDNYQNADLLVISDFIMKNLAESLKSKINYLKNEKKIKFYGLILGKKKNIKMDIFDDFWVFSEKRLVKK